MTNDKEYNRIHKWAERHLKKTGVCFYCGRAGRTQWSNIDHEYRQKPSEWQEVCHRCHRQYDVEVLGVVIGRPPKRLITYAWFKPVEKRTPKPC